MVFQKGNKPWNYKLTKETDSRLQSASNALKLKYKTDSNIKCGFKKGHKFGNRFEKGNKVTIGQIPWQKVLGNGHPKVIEYKKKMAIQGKEINTGRKSPRKGLTKYTDKSIMKGAITLKKRYDNGEQLGFRNIETKQKAFRNMKKGRNKDTRPERMMKSILKELNLRFIPQYQIGRYFADFYLPDYKLCLEVDGHYWHNYPYSTEYDMQRNIDIGKHKISTIRFWESEVENKDFCKKILLDTVYNRKHFGCIYGGKINGS